MTALTYAISMGLEAMTKELVDGGHIDLNGIKVKMMISHNFALFAAKPVGSM